MRDLEGTLMLVAGGAGAVGEGIVGALLRGGARVIVLSRSETKLAELGAHLQPGAGGRLVPLQGDVADPADAERLRAHIAATLGPLDAVVASLGGWWQGPAVADVDLAAWGGVMHERLVSHFVCARAFAPSLAEHHGIYVIVNGASAYYPIPSSGLVSIAGSALLMLARVLATEGRPDGVTYRSVVLETSIVTRATPKGGPEWLTADEVGRFIARLIAEGGGDSDDPIVRLQFKNQVPAE